MPRVLVQIQRCVFSSLICLLASACGGDTVSANAAAATHFKNLVRESAVKELEVPQEGLFYSDEVRQIARAAIDALQIDVSVKLINRVGNEFQGSVSVYFSTELRPKAGDPRPLRSKGQVTVLYDGLSFQVIEDTWERARTPEEVARLAARSMLKDAREEFRVAQLPWEVLRQDPDPTVVTDAAARARMAATKLPWKVRDKKTGIVMLLCPTGEFTMGAPLSEGRQPRIQTKEREAERLKYTRQHRRAIGEPFYISETEITQQQWQLVMGTSPSRFIGAANPVEMVSWNDCRRFCEATELRLPSEAEWEYACRAGTQGPYAGPIDEMAWHNANSDGRTHPVATKRANAWGLFDMHGNVAEWCEDGYDEYPLREGTHRAARGDDGVHRVVRGGAYIKPVDICRSGKRLWHSPQSTSEDCGFRVARTAR